MKKLLKIGARSLLNFGYSILVWIISVVGVLPVITTLVGAIIGGLFGASIGIASNGGADDGIKFMAIIGGIIGCLGGGWFNAKQKYS